MSNQDSHEALSGVAIVGMSGRFPRARAVEDFWRNLRDGVEAISFFTDEELLAEGLDPATLADPGYVKAKGLVEDIELFDASFFGITPREAEMTDPQQRFFLECAWAALESAGYDSEQYRGAIGLFAGASLNSYLVLNLLSSAGLVDASNILQSSIPNRTDHLTTRVAYKLNLKGPAVTVQTACSTSLVAVHLACQSLLSYQCDMALAGGVTVSVPKKSGYFYQEGGVLSPDGHCRAFDHRAGGTVVGNGVGVVVLKRLSDALEDGDEIHAVIKGSAINNDGSAKIGYTAPSVEGQSEVIATAMELAGVEPETVSYIEAHGTGTKLGDPMELATLRRVFRARTDRKNFCAIGSVKTNIGHLDAAAGVAGLIKTTLALRHRELPPSLNFERPNPEIDFSDSPFYVNTRLAEWKSDGGPRRAGVSSFGIGGTNAHVVLEEAPPPAAGGASRPSQLLVLSARTASALESATENLAAYLKQNPRADLADVAYTLKVGRRAFNHRRALVCRSADEAVEALESLDPRRVVTGLQEPKRRPVVFMFPGQGAQYVGMGRELYESEAAFRSEVDYCSERLTPLLGFDLREVLFAPEEKAEEGAARLTQTSVTQPALFVVEYALAKLLAEWGVTPQAMIGHSVGEYVAACLAGVFTLDDALALVAARGRLMQSAEPGAMTAVPLPEAEVLALMGPELSLASVNAPSLCVVAGPDGAVAEFEARAASRGVACRRLQTSHAFHSRMMEPILDAFRAEVERVRLSAPQIPYVSNLTGAWAATGEVTDSGYWVKHLRRTVRFGDGVAELFKEPDSILLEVGPGRTLMTVARWHPSKGAGHAVLTTLPHPQERVSAVSFALESLGRLWLAGVEVNWGNFYARESRRRVSLPTYPFERKHYWVEPRPRAGGRGAPSVSPRKKADISDWFYVPSWKSSAPRANREARTARRSHANWLVFRGVGEVGEQLSRAVERLGVEVTTVTAGEAFAARGEREFTIRPRHREDYSAMLKHLSERGKWPTDILHLWNASPVDESRAGDVQGLGFYSLLALAQALGEHGEADAVRLNILTSDMQRVTGDESLCPERALVTGPLRVVPQELKHVRTRSIDFTHPAEPRGRERLVELLLGELFSDAPESVVAYRHNLRWTQTFEPHPLGRADGTPTRLRPRGVYLITGGMGGIGQVFAEHLARTVRARLVLVGRSAFPSRERWRRWLATHEEGDETSRGIRRLQELETLGARVEVFSADVSDREEMARVLAQAREQFGPVNGVIHAAGVAGGGMLQLKTEEKAAAILAPKVEGAKVLGELFAGDGLDFMLLCSSRSSILGGFGQIDYCAANAFLDAFAHDYASRTGTFTVSVDWDGWQGVGMLVNTAAHYGVGAADAPAAREAGHPLLGRRAEAADGGEVFVTRFSVAEHWILEEHRIGGTAVLPGVTYIEMARAAFERHAGGGPVELRDVYFISPMSIRDDERREVRLVFEKHGDGFKFHASSRSALDRDGDAEWQDHAVGEIRRAPASPPKRHDLRRIIEAGGLRELAVDDDERDPDLGPRWQNIKKVYAGEREVLVLFELPAEFAGDLEHMKLHPSLLDRAAGTGMLYMQLEGIYLPMSYRTLHFKEPLPRAIYAHIKQTEGSDPQQETITFDVVITDEEGTELVEIGDFSEKRINDLTGQVKAMADKSRRPAPTAGERRPAPGGEKSFYEQSMDEGIAPPEGSEVFERLLAAAPVPQVVVSTRDLQASIENANAFTQEAVSAEIEKLQVARSQHPRPNVQTEYVAPRNHAEQVLAEIMREMLGVDRVGVNDNFFELGGDSVLSIQIIARAGRAGLKISPQQIFQHQTVAGMAAVALSEPGAEPAAAESPASAGAAEEGVAPAAAFSRAGLDARQLNKLSKLIAADDEDEDDEEEDESVVEESGAHAATAQGAARASAEELEAILRQHPSVREAVVVARGGANGGANGGGPVAYVVLAGDSEARAARRSMEFSLFYFAADNSQSGADKYRLYLEGAKFADAHGFAAVWTPERHFHVSGGLYPSPSVLSAGLATVTERIQLRAGSVVMPLHHSIRVAEEWSVVDNLSGGRVGLSFTSGWIPNDFAFFPERYADKRGEMLRGIEEVRRLWRGQTITARDGAGKEFELSILPRPIQPELPVWLTCSGDPWMFVKAGELGVNVLTALLSQTVEELAGKIKLYREARARHGHDPAAGNVAVMVHAFVAPDERKVLAEARAPLSEYLKAHVGLVETMTNSLDIKVDIDKEKYLDDLVAFAFERYYQTASLLGTPEKCLEMVGRLRQSGVDEVACFIDFGVRVEAVLDSLEHLNVLKELSAAESAATAPAGNGARGAGAVHSLREFVSRRIPPHASQPSFVVVDALPLRPDGTVDYGALGAGEAPPRESEPSLTGRA